jgi:hypothetical protein
MIIIRNAKLLKRVKAAKANAIPLTGKKGAQYP